MKKLLLALALSAGFVTAQAQSSVTVYGLMDGSYTQAENSSKTTAGGATTDTKSRNTVNGDGAYATSRLGFRGNEDLGGGRSAQFVLEFDLVNIGNGSNGTDTGLAQSSNSNGRTEGFGARYSWIGIEDKNLGALRIGRQESPVHWLFMNSLAGQGNNMPGTTFSSGSSNANVISAGFRPYDGFVDQAITYITPTVSNLTAQVQYSQNAYSASQTTPSAGFQQAGAGIRYTGIKNLTVNVAFQQDNAVVANTSNAKRVATALGANYNFGPVTAFGLYSTHKNNNLVTGAVTRDQKATELGLRAPIGKAVEVWASSVIGTKTESTNSATLAATTTGNADLKGYQVGTQYHFSKRTFAYAILGTQEIKGKDAAINTKISSTSYALGMLHRF